MNARQVEQLTLWEIFATIDAHERLNPSQPDYAMQPPSNDDFDRMIARKKIA